MIAHRFVPTTAPRALSGAVRTAVQFTTP
jgi:hypothetical protein